MSGFRLAALDLDGTLVDSAPDLSHCLGEALDSVGLGRPGLAEATSWIGDGVEALVTSGLTAGLGKRPDKALFRRTLERFDACYGENLFRSSRLYPEVATTLETLRTAGMTVGCITNKRETYALRLLDQAGILAALDFVYGGDRFAAKKPDPEPLLAAAAACGIPPAEAVMIGDSRNDRRAAEAAGFAFVFAAFGYASADDPELNRAYAAVTCFAELGELLCVPRSGK